MSYSISIDYHDGTHKSFPMATEGTYTTFWEAPAKILGLKLILSIVDTLSIRGRESAEKFRDEMIVLRNYYLDQGVNQEKSDIERIERLIGKFDNAIDHWDAVELIFVS